MWFYFFCVLEVYIFDNFDDLDVKVSRCDFMIVIVKLQKLLVLFEFDQYILCFFNVFIIILVQWLVVCDIGIVLYMKFFDYFLVLLIKEVNEEVIVFDVEDMLVVGKVKVCYVGGWVIRKVFEKFRRYVRVNMYSENV